MSLPLVRYVLTAAVRDRLILSLLIVMAVGVSLSVFLGTSAISEQDRFALVFAGSGLRLAGVLGLVLFTVFFIRRSFDARDVEFLLSRPVSRVEFLVSYAMSLSILALGVTAVQAFCLFVLSPHNFDQGHSLWVVTMALENIVMANVALFFSMILTSAPSAAMATAGFYVLARMMGQLLGIVDSHEGIGPVFEALRMIMQIISAVMPRLDLMGQSSWLIYDATFTTSTAFILGQGIVFMILILLGSLIDLVRRQF